MCGIAGLIAKRPPEDLRRSVSAMTDRLAHRGPDGQSVWIDESVGLGHRRLAIVDLSPTGIQPMQDTSGRYSITFNGEIYNYQELRNELVAAGVTLRSTSDTEVLLELFVRHGRGALDKIRGMFAFAIWDKEKRELFFARDRIGKKPFFYRDDGARFSFASEPTSLLEGGEQVDWGAIRSFLGLQYVPSPASGWLEIRSLPPGHCGVYRDGATTIECYASFDRTPKLDVSFDEAAREVRRILDESVRLRMIADVDVGTFLSGGIDSSAIACLMAKRSSQPIKTFTMGFPSFGFDERAAAARLAESLGAEHHAFEARPETALASIDRVLESYGAPFADASAIPTYLLAQETRSHVKAVMTGDGGDELFGGYRRYRYFASAMRLKRLGLAWPSINIAWMLDSLRNDSRYRRFATTLEGLRRSPAHGYADLFTGAYFNRDDVRTLLRPEFMEQTKQDDAGSFIVKLFDQGLGIEGTMDFDLRSYLPDDLNVKMDRATMAHGLEARSPLLDQELVSYVTRLPSSLLLSSKGQKALLAAAVKDVVPAEVFTRPKRGFQVPLAEWFRGPLRSVFVERCLSTDVALANICRVEEMKRFLHENDRGRDHGNRLWMLLSLSTWLEKYA